MASKNKQHLIWIDLEMTGLNAQTDCIIEIASVVTDEHLNIVEIGPDIAIQRTADELARMDAWNQKTHAQSGLIQKVTESQVSCQAAEQSTLKFLQQHTFAQTSPLCGNSITQDRFFLVKEMPELACFLHYRNIDVSSIKELAKRWQPKLYQQVKKKSTHTALSDILESIDELKFYRQNWLN